jgi:hypothetical protein
VINVLANLASIWLTFQGMSSCSTRLDVPLDEYGKGMELMHGERGEEGGCAYTVT